MFPMADPQVAAGFAPASLAFGMTSERATVLRNVALNAEHRHLVLSCSPLAASARPGQFFHLLCPRPDGEAAQLRPVSLFSAKRDPDEIEFIYRTRDGATLGLEALANGDRIAISSPLGSGFALSPHWRSIVVAGRDAGMATLAAVAASAARLGIAVTAILSARRPDLVVAEDTYRSHGARVLALSDRDGTGAPDQVALLVRRLIAQGECEAVFTCGSAALARSLHMVVREHGIPGQISLEQRSACENGICRYCLHEMEFDLPPGLRRRCNEGPVFDLADPAR